MNLYPIFLREIMIFWNRLKKPSFVFASIFIPLLYLVTFGVGLGNRISINGISYLIFIVPGICAMSAMNNSFNGISTTIVVGRLYFKSMEEILVSPVSYLSIAIGEVTAGAVRGLFGSFFIIIGATFLGAPLPNSILFYFGWIITTFTFSALGVVAGFKAKTHDDTSIFSNFIIIPMSFLCGTFFPVENLPKAIAYLIKVLPLTHSIAIMRAGYTNSYVNRWYIIALVFYCVGSILWAVKSIKGSIK
ncbi:MAG: ABC transporter permease [Chitinispirillaceae bacterium]|nr:ABC transporter permease [Chitinispirillaceae bacterium]